MIFPKKFFTLLVTILAAFSLVSAFYAIDGLGSEESPSAATDIIKLSTFARRASSARITAQIKNPINVAFDNKIDRMLILQFPDKQLLEVLEGLDGSLDPKTLTRYDAGGLGLQNPQGMTVDPASGTLFILDTVGPQIVRVEPGLNGSFDGAVVSKVNLQSSGLVAPRGLAFDPTTSHFYLVSPVEKKLYEFSQSGKVIASHDLSQFRLGTPQGMVFAPSGDQTDDPLQMSLYLADSGSGQILEFSLIDEPARMAAAASSAQSSLIRTTNLAAISPPSPDPSGLTYLPLSNTLLISDGEVEEKVSGITHFAGANLWETTLTGGVVRTANISPVAPTVVPMTDEPTGAAWNPANGHFFFSDDNAYKVFDLNPGTDGQYGSADDTWTSFDTLALGIGDPEGITFDTWHNQLFVVDGTNREIYQFTLAGSLIAHFDVATYGVTDPESVEFNPESGTLFVLSSASNPVIIETTTSGALLQTIDVSAYNAEAPAGLAYAPASDGSGTKHFYILDRGVDNNNDPNLVDGKMYEMSAPLSGQPTVTYGPSMTATITFTPTTTNTPKATATRTSTRTPTNTRTATMTRTSTASITPTKTVTGTFTPTAVNSPTPTPTGTITPTLTVTSPFTQTVTSSSTLTPTGTITPTSPVTGTFTPTEASSFTLTPTGTITLTMTPTGTFTPTAANSQTLTPTRTITPTSVPGNTGFLNPAMNAVQTGGDGNGYQVSAGNAYTNDSLFAADNNSGTGTSSSCTNAGKDKHRFYNYNIAIPGGAVVKGIQVRLDAKADSISGSPKLCVQLSWDGGTTWTTAKSTTRLTTAETTYLLGGAGDAWGHAWATNQLGNTTFRVRVIDVATSTSRDFSLDWVAVQVTYQ